MRNRQKTHKIRSAEFQNRSPIDDISPFVGSNNPAKCGNDQFVLRSVLQDMRPVPHVKVDHPVIRIGPDYRHVAFGNDMLDPHGKILGR